MLTHVSHRGPMCHLMVASHNEESVRQATKRYVEGWEMGPHKEDPSIPLPCQGWAEGGGHGIGVGMVRDK